jgi:hypothetical protein
MDRSFLIGGAAMAGGAPAMPARAQDDAARIALATLYGDLERA